MTSRTLAAGVLALTLSGAFTQPSPAKAADGFPVTVRAASGRVTIPERPRRIVVLGATHTETLFAIGAGRQVVAVDVDSNHPRRAPRTRLSTVRPNAEAIARYRPDLVVTSTRANKLLPSMRRLRIPVLLAPAATHIGGAYEQMRQIGSATGRRAAADGVIRRMRRRIRAVLKTTPSGRGVSFFHEVSPDLYSATSRTFIGRVYRLFGLRNIADRAGKATPYPQLSTEYVLAADPDIVVLGDAKCCAQSARTVARRPGWDRLSAVRRDRVFAVNDDIASRWGPRVADFVEAVGRAVRRTRR